MFLSGNKIDVKVFVSFCRHLVKKNLPKSSAIKNNSVTLSLTISVFAECRQMKDLHYII